MELATLIVLIGPQGSGKTSLAQSLSDTLNLPHISTGEILREKSEEDEDDVRSQILSGILNRGEMVSDVYTYRVLTEALNSDRCEMGAVIDGYPRNLEQTKNICSYFNSRLVNAVHLIVFLEVNPIVCIRRILNRREEEGRADDANIDSILTRMEYYYDTKWMVENYVEGSDCGYYTADAADSIADNTKQIKEMVRLLHREQCTPTHSRKGD